MTPRCVDRVAHGRLWRRGNAHVTCGAVVLCFGRARTALVVDCARTRVWTRWRVALTVLVTSNGLQNVGWLLGLVDLGLQTSDLSFEGCNLVAQFVLAILQCRQQSEETKGSLKAYLVQTFLGVSLLELELDKGVIRVKLRVRLLNLVKLRLSMFKLALGFLSAPLPLIRPLSCLKKRLARGLGNLLMIRHLGLHILHATLERSMLSLKGLAAIPNTPELLHLFGVHLAHERCERLNLFRRTTQFVPVALLRAKLIVLHLLRRKLLRQCLLLASDE